MKSKLLLILLAVVIVTGCNKDKLDTVPKLKLKSISNSVVPVNGSVRILLEFADKEGDLTNSIFVQKIRTNKTVVPTTRDSFSLKMPSFPANSRGEITIDLNYQEILSAINPPTIPGSNPPAKQPDTLLVKLAVRDNAAHVSDTITTPQLVIIR